MLADPDFTQKCMDGDEAQIRRCLRCYKCFPGSPEEGYDDLPFTSEQLAVYVGHCTINPTAHLPFDVEQLPPAEKGPQKVLIVGGGIAGIQAAITAAKAKLALEDDAAQADVNKALADLKDAENNLEAKPADKPDKGNLTTAVDAAAKTDLNGYTKESVDAFKKALDEAQKVLKDENATKEQIENVLAKLDAAKKALKKDTTPDTEKPTPTPETKVPAVGATTTVKGVKYAVTKSAAKGGTAEAVKVTGKGKKITIAATVKIDGVTFKVTSIKKNAAKKNKNMTSVVIGKNVTSIGANSFANSKKLANVTLKGTKAVKVGSKAFKGTSAKMKVVIPKKMSKKTLNTLKRNLKKAGISKKTVYKKK